MKLYSFELNGKKVEGYAQIIKEKLWVYLGGETFVVDEAVSDRRTSGRTRKKLEGRSAPDRLSAPMPGKITKILCAEGVGVNIGQALIVMEAMKMEYTLKSEMNGAVLKINVKVGQQVALGEVLLQLKEG
jgi:acetyl/propionyl-CoA carboxylase alpha subunit